MVKSMTGYGRAEETVNGCTITVELRSVNNRYLDCNVRIPRLYLFSEDAIKTRVQSAISRGKVDVFVTMDSTGADDIQVSVNRPLAAQYAAGGEEVYLYACGGDGTLNEILQGTVGRPNAAIGCVPCGSGNDYVRNFGTQAQFLDLDAQLAAQPVSYTHLTLPTN